MTPLLRAELLKLRTTRTFVALAGVALGTSLLIVTLICLLSEPSEDAVLEEVFTADTTTLFILVLAVVGIAGEWRHRTITSSLLAAPDRLRFLAAKTLAFATAGLLLSLLVSTAITVVGLTLLSLRDLPVPDAGALAGQICRNALPAALLGGFGVGIGAIVRNQVVAIVGVLVAMLLVEPTLTALVPEIGRFGPLSALPTMAAGIPPDDGGLGEIEPIPSLLAGLALLAWNLAAYAAGAALLRRRDLH